MANRATTKYCTRWIPNKDNKKTAGNKTNFSGVLSAMPKLMPNQRRVCLYLFIVFFLFSFSPLLFASNRFCDRFAIFVAFIFLFIRIRCACGAYEQMKSFRSWKWWRYRIKNNDDVVGIGIGVYIAATALPTSIHSIYMLDAGVTALQVWRQMLTHFWIHNWQHVKYTFRCRVGKNSDPTFLIGYPCYAAIDVPYADNSVDAPLFSIHIFHFLHVNYFKINYANGTTRTAYSCHGRVTVSTHSARHTDADTTNKKCAYKDWKKESWRNAKRISSLCSVRWVTVSGVAATTRHRVLTFRNELCRLSCAQYYWTFLPTVDTNNGQFGQFFMVFSRSVLSISNS